jgi:integrase
MGWLVTDPTLGWARPRIDVDTARSLTRRQIDALFELDVGLREKTLWRMLYETAARANEILSLDVDDLDLANNRAAVRGKGGTIRSVVWQTGAARLLTGRRTGPAFLSAGPPRIPVAVCDRDPLTSRARLSYRRAAELFEHHTQVLLARGRDEEPVYGWTLHQLRHSALTHDAEQGTSDAPRLGCQSGLAAILNGACTFHPSRPLAKYRSYRPRFSVRSARRRQEPAHQRRWRRRQSR